jgi:hypothetical protein
MSQKERNKPIQEWLTNWKKEHLSPEIIKLITQSDADLWHGPFRTGSFGDPTVGDEEWDSYPGFFKATALIADALENQPSDLYLDIDTGFISETEPQPEKCQECDGQGSVTVLATDEYDEHTRKCANCNGLGCFQSFGEWEYFDRKEIRKALVGSELSLYI